VDTSTTFIPQAEKNDLPHHILNLQQTRGNAYVRRMLDGMLQRQVPTKTIDFSEEEGSIITAGEAAEVETDSALEAIEQKMADLRAKKLKGGLPGGEEVTGRTERVDEIREIREEIASLDAKTLGMTPEALKLKKAQFYAELNRSVPFYMQTNNADILYAYTRGKRNVAGQRTCNVTSLSSALEGLGVSSSDFTGDKQLLNLILDEQQAAMTGISEKEEAKEIENIKDKDEKKKEKKQADIRARHEKKRTDIEGWDLDSFRLPDFMQLVVIYVMLTQEIFFSKDKKVKALNIPVDDLKKMAVDNPAQFKETVQQAQQLARNAILKSWTFSHYAGLFGVKNEMKSLPDWEKIRKMGSWGRMRWDIRELEKQIEEEQKKLDAIEGDDKKAQRARKTIQQKINSLKSRIKRKEKSIDKKTAGDFTSLDEFEDYFPLEDYKALVEKTYLPLLSSGKQVEISMFGHFVYLIAIEDDGVTVHEVGEGDGKQKKISWEKARAAGYFYNYNVFYK
jgi:hypothetical protein